MEFWEIAFCGPPSLKLWRVNEIYNLSRDGEIGRPARLVPNADVVKLANTYASGAYAERLEGSSPSIGTRHLAGGRTGFRCQRPQGHESSSLSRGTNFFFFLI